MLSNGLHQFSTYQSLSVANTVPAGHVPSNHLRNNGMDRLTHGSQYPMQQVQRRMDAHEASQSSGNMNPKHRHHPYNSISRGGANETGVAANGASTSGPIRRRISRACDQCNQLRTKCDGQSPCAHCVEFSLSCEYIRERKKRGKASRKDLAQQAAVAAAAENSQMTPPDQSFEEITQMDLRVDQGPSVDSSTTNNSDSHDPGSRTLSLGDGAGISNMNGDRESLNPRARSLGSLLDGSQQLLSSRPDDLLGQAQVQSPTDLGLNYTSMHAYVRPDSHLLGATSGINYGSSDSLSGFAELSYSMQSPSNYPINSHSPTFRLGDGAMPGFSMATPPIPSPGWGSMPSPITQFQLNSQHVQPSLRYPVLQPLVPHLGSIVPLSLACELLDLYFASSSSAQMHPMSPYVLGFVFRKRSFLHPSKPRLCSPALLASMLWVAAQTSDAAFLTMPPSARARVCQKLLELTVGLLKPLIHGPPTGESSPNFADTVVNGVALGGLGVSTLGSVGAHGLNGGNVAFGAAGALDDVVTYIHLATVVSASEYKGASLRWWNAAWSLARELKLGRELPASSSHHLNGEADADAEADDDLDISHGQSSASGTISEEQREERRRIWWLVYTVDRHLSLCYNKPLFLLDVECDGLLQPMDDTIWQMGEFFSGDSSIQFTSPNGSQRIRRRGPHFECSGHSIFGYFLPLMTILGEIVDLNHAKNHPRFGVGFRSHQEWDDLTNEISQQLEAYGRSLKEFEQRNLSNGDDRADVEIGMDGMQATNHHDMKSPSGHSVHTSTSHLSSESEIQTRIVVAYGTHVMHVLHILLTGKWDPLSLLDDNDLWISTQGFINATGHAVSAAEAIEYILEYDPGLEFMPFFFGVYLLQGSFLLLLIADKLQTEASPSVVKACETIVRAHEACVATLNTEYQRNFRKVMRSALAQVRGRVPEDTREQQLRRREVLSLYRWTGDGTGLAL